VIVAETKARCLAEGRRQLSPNVGEHNFAREVTAPVVAQLVEPQVDLVALKPDIATEAHVRMRPLPADS
jgi:hypothetical protein